MNEENTQPEMEEVLEPLPELTEEQRAANKAQADQLQRDMIAEAQNRAQDATEVAATIYHMYLPKFKAGMKRLGVKARDRVWQHILEFPLNEKPHNPPTQLEKELFYLGHALMEAKWVMITDSVRSGMEKIVTANENALTEEEASAIVSEFGFEEPTEEVNKETT